MKRRAVITGMGILTALGSGKVPNWAGIIEGRSAIAPITSFDRSGYRATTGGEVKDQDILKDGRSKRRDRATKLLITAANEAVGQSGLAGKLPARTPLFTGTTLGGMIGGTAYHRAILDGMAARPSLVLDYLSHIQAVRLRDAFGLGGGVSAISNACASGTNAIGFAFKDVQYGEADVAIAAGYDTMSEFTYAGFNSLQALSPTVCRPFDRNRDGLTLGEGAAVLIIEELVHAKERGATILAEITGYGESSDAYHITRPDPAGSWAAEAMKEALDDAGTPIAEIDYINAHGTGTPANDVMETAAIRSVLGLHAGRVPVSSTKPIVGHLLGGAGAVEAVITVMAMQAGILPPNLNYNAPDPDCALNIVTEAGQKADIRVSLSNSFGFGGANAVLILRRWDGRA